MPPTPSNLRIVYRGPTCCPAWKGPSPSRVGFGEGLFRLVTAAAGSNVTASATEGLGVATVCGNPVAAVGNPVGTPNAVRAEAIALSEASNVGVPHLGQNPAPCGTGWPHFAHGGLSVVSSIQGRKIGPQLLRNSLAATMRTAR